MILGFSFLPNSNFLNKMSNFIVMNKTQTKQLFNDHKPCKN